MMAGSDKEAIPNDEGPLLCFFLYAKVKVTTVVLEGLQDFTTRNGPFLTDRGEKSLIFGTENM